MSVSPKSPTQGLDPEKYLKVHSPPSHFQQCKDDIDNFLEFWSQIPDRKIALVTSGGTTVPLESQTVRFLDNFSAGTRGATSAEFFLEHGYSVIFLHRQFSLQPYSRHYSHTTNCFLDYLEMDPKSNQIQVEAKYAEEMKDILFKYKDAKDNRKLLAVSFVTVSDYLFLLNYAAQAMAPLESRALFYLAAAVSDFFIPPELMAQHKIQSTEGELNISLSKVPKFLKPLVSKWAPNAFIVSFKLETDPLLLEPKAKQALVQYGHQLVIGNLLGTRKHEVWFFTVGKEPVHLQMPTDSPHMTIESLFLPRLFELHSSYK
ncbi:Phosphopantothenate--cysteine ligase cab2 [Entomophthora muscae]|uniref:Phosphopantothenate--cysteine ligase cab2 n=1 Tax=Entomophthora muscae TaxID=34485 RepID=A0ACC2UA15_9FUNG|nr:Phosphopantothenate--cysteine ligase cab2 [Entomophthora muscae]